MKKICTICQKLKECTPYWRAENWVEESNSEYVDLYVCERCNNSPFRKKYEENFKESKKIQDEIASDFWDIGLDIFEEWQNDKQ